MSMRKIIIAPYQMHRNLLKKYRQEDAFFDVKTISKENLLGEYYGSADDLAIPFLMKKYKYSYDNVIALFRFLPYVSEEQKDFSLIKKDLVDNHLIIKNDYLDQFFKNNEVYIYGYSKRDKELITVLDKLGIKYEFVLNDKKDSGGILNTYETQFDEVFYTLNSIASLLDKGEDINKIYIYVTNNEYLYPLKEFSKGFGFTVDDEKSYPLYVTPIARQFLDNYLSTKDNELSKERIAGCLDKDLLNDIYQVIDSCVDPEMDFATQFDYLVGELKTTNASRKQFKDIVRIINKPIYDNDAHIFVMGFAQGSYPRSIKDNELFSDSEKDKMGLNSSLEETQNNQDTLLDFFNSDNHFYYSFAERSLSKKYFKSPLVKTIGLTEERHELPNVIYSRDMVDFYYAKLKDLKEFYRETKLDYYALEKISNIPYGQYDNSFNGVDAMNEDMKTKYSYSVINDYYQCPFKYFVSNILELDTFEGNFYTKFGNVAHKIFEHHNDEGFDFDKVFDEEAIKQDFADEELPILENLKTQIRRASEAIRLHQRYMTNPRIVTEKKIGMDLGKKSYLSGVIDKSIVFDDKYLILVDYKTGNDSFDTKYLSEGISLQLPTYCLLASKDSDLKNYQIIGTFINNVVNTKLAYGYDKERLIDPYYRLNGKVAADKELIAKIDDTINNNKSEFIKGVSITKAGQFAKDSSLVSIDDFKEYAEIALRKYLEADTNIRKNNFVINPLFKSKSNNACKYCEYKDLCFVKKEQRRYLYTPDEDEEEDEDDE